MTPRADIPEFDCVLTSNGFELSTIITIGTPVQQRLYKSNTRSVDCSPAAATGAAATGTPRRQGDTAMLQGIDASALAEIVLTSVCTSVQHCSLRVPALAIDATTLGTIRCTAGSTWATVVTTFSHY